MTVSKRFPRLAAIRTALSRSRATQGQPSVGDPAPDFRLQDQDGRSHSLAGHRGEWVVLYFYPKDKTPGCTKEACAFRDRISAFTEIGAVVLGVSADGLRSHGVFAEKYRLPFSLLADTDGTVARQYGALMDLKLIKFAKRKSFLIAPDGTIARHYERIDPAQHSAEVLADLRALAAATTS